MQWRIKILKPRTQDPDPETMRAELKQAFRLFDKNGTVRLNIALERKLETTLNELEMGSCNSPLSANVAKCGKLALGWKAVNSK